MKPVRKEEGGYPERIKHSIILDKFGATRDFLSTSSLSTGFHLTDDDKGTWGSVSMQGPATATFTLSVIQILTLSDSVCVSARQDFAPAIDSSNLCKFSEMPTIKEPECIVDNNVYLLQVMFVITSPARHSVRMRLATDLMEAARFL